MTSDPSTPDDSSLGRPGVRPDDPGEDANGGVDGGANADGRASATAETDRRATDDGTTPDPRSEESSAGGLAPEGASDSHWVGGGLLATAALGATAPILYGIHGRAVGDAAAVASDGRSAGWVLGALAVGVGLVAVALWIARQTYRGTYGGAELSAGLLYVTALLVGSYGWAEGAGSPYEGVALTTLALGGMAWVCLWGIVPLAWSAGLPDRAVAGRRYGSERFLARWAWALGWQPSTALVVGGLTVVATWLLARPVVDWLAGLSPWLLVAAVAAPWLLGAAHVVRTVGDVTERFREAVADRRTDRVRPETETATTLYGSVGGAPVVGPRRVTATTVLVGPDRLRVVDGPTLDRRTRRVVDDPTHRAIDHESIRAVTYEAPFLVVDTDDRALRLRADDRPDDLVAAIETHTRREVTGEAVSRAAGRRPER